MSKVVLEEIALVLLLLMLEAASLTHPCSKA